MNVPANVLKKHSIANGLQVLVAHGPGRDSLDALIDRRSSARQLATGASR